MKVLRVLCPNLTDDPKDTSKKKRQTQETDGFLLLQEIFLVFSIFVFFLFFLSKNLYLSRVKQTSGRTSFSFLSSWGSKINKQKINLKARKIFSFLYTYLLPVENYSSFNSLTGKFQSFILTFGQDFLNSSFLSSLFVNNYFKNYEAVTRICPGFQLLDSWCLQTNDSFSIFLLIF